MSKTYAQSFFKPVAWANVMNRHIKATELKIKLSIGGIAFSLSVVHHWQLMLRFCAKKGLFPILFAFKAHMIKGNCRSSISLCFLTVYISYYCFGAQSRNTSCINFQTKISLSISSHASVNLAAARSRRAVLPRASQKKHLQNNVVHRTYFQS